MGADCDHNTYRMCCCYHINSHNQVHGHWLQSPWSGRIPQGKNTHAHQKWYTHVFLFFAHFHFPASGQAVVTGVIPSPPRFLPSISMAHRVQQSHCSSIVHRVLLTHALALSASQFVHKKNSQRIFTSTHSAGLELTKLTYTRLKDNLIRHRGDVYIIVAEPINASAKKCKKYAPQIAPLLAPDCKLRSYPYVQHAR